MQLQIVLFSQENLKFPKSSIGYTCNKNNIEFVTYGLLIFGVIKQNRNLYNSILNRILFVFYIAEKQWH